MEEKLQQLQKKLGDEESERKEMTIQMSQMNEKQSEEKETILKVSYFVIEFDAILLMQLTQKIGLISYC